ncbi:hypothetical protein Y032_0042g507 [Ancylostoma ceylanicum]|uniref:Uncharacterized protein n=1 Tax=Ancylostoma ceylanicum TaxID=53326 RepID=A0A016UEK6_9BILA|nr:hypothetical protein Y032_0042g507 [Ancylostoma ceylanicum]
MISCWFRSGGNYVLQDVQYHLLPFTNRYNLVAILKNSVEKARFSPTPRAEFSEETLRKGKELPEGFSAIL